MCPTGMCNRWHACVCPALPLQGSDKELSDYSLAELAARHLGGMPPGSPADAPLARVRRALEASVALGEAMHARLSEAQLPGEAMQREMTVRALGAGLRWGAAGLHGEQAVPAEDATPALLLCHPRCRLQRCCWGVERHMFTTRPVISTSSVGGAAGGASGGQACLFGDWPE